MIASPVQKFIAKFFFILKAAADGWIVRYIGGDQFEFYKKKTKQSVSSTGEFLQAYALLI